MSALDNFRFVDVAGRARDAYDDIKTVRTDQARMRAGNALSGGDYRGAAGALFEAGDIDGGARVAYYGDRRAADDREARAAREKAATEAWGQAAERLSRILDESKDDPNAVLGAFDTYFAPRLQSLGETPDEIGQVRGMIQQAPRQALLALGAGAAKKLGYDVKAVGGELFITDLDAGKVIARYRGAQTIRAGAGDEIYEIPGSGGPVGQEPRPQVQDQGPQRAPGMGEVGPAMSGRDASSMMDALIAQESGGDGNAVGPRTAYGQAQGSTQMLMATAEGMARKLGIPWNPSLMRGDTPTALAYQRRLGQAYLQEGLDKYGGDIRQALRYYHGGPDESLWGPKTNAYADAVIGRMGQGGEALAGGSGRDTVQPSSAPPGARLLISRPEAAKEQVRPATADEKAAYGIPADVPARRMPNGSVEVVTGVGARQKPIPVKIQDGYISNRTSLRQIREAIAAIRANPSALGLKNYMPEAWTQRGDPGGVKTRAPVANIGSLIIHDRSGAAVTAAETPRLKPFVPQVTDTPEAAIDKLEALAREIENRNAEIEVTYGPDSDYTPLRTERAPAARAGQPPRTAPNRQAMEYLRANPNLRQQFDAKYGAGAAARVLGK